MQPAASRCSWKRKDEQSQWKVFPEMQAERMSEPNQDIVARERSLLIGHRESGKKAELAGTVVLYLPARCRSCSELGLTPVGFRQCEIFYWTAGTWSRLSSTAREMKTTPTEAAQIAMFRFVL